MAVSQLKKELIKARNPKQARLLQRFFKTGPGEYGHGDLFLGLKSQQIKDVAKKYNSLDLYSLEKLLASKIHEERMCAVRILIKKYEKSKDQKQRKKIFNFYIKNSRKINNWDLVDVSAPHIVGDYLLNQDRKILYKLAKSENIWQRRISVLTTSAFIRENDFKDILKISEMLLTDKHDLIHKATGWMLREVGKRNKTVLINFLNKHAAKMSRIMLRYAIEKFTPSEKQSFLKKIK